MPKFKNSAIEVLILGDCAQLATKSAYADIVRNTLEIKKNQPLSRAALEVLAIIAYNQIRMANLSVIASHTVNGVSALHSQILKDSVFKDFYRMYPGRFDNVTNGIAHRRWLCYSNPELAGLLDETIGTGYRKNPVELAEFAKFADDPEVLERFRAIKHQNKENFSNHLYRKAGIRLDTHAVFDVQIKRLHEYKRQLLNALNIIGMYLDLKDNPDLDIRPQTFIFGAKAAPGYYMAKRIIQLLCMLQKEINQNPRIREKLNVVFLENYDVSTAEILVPSADISEQISLAGKEASGTGCMKLMMNGAMTIGTLDGANVEMLDAVGDDNMFIFGLTAEEVDALWLEGYRSTNYYTTNERLARIVNYLTFGFAGESFADIAAYLLGGQIGLDMFPHLLHQLQRNGGVAQLQQLVQCGLTGLVGFQHGCVLLICCTDHSEQSRFLIGLLDFGCFCFDVCLVLFTFGDGFGVVCLNALFQCKEGVFFGFKLFS